MVNEAILLVGGYDRAPYPRPVPLDDGLCQPMMVLDRYNFSKAFAGGENNYNAASFFDSFWAANYRYRTRGVLDGDTLYAFGGQSGKPSGCGTNGKNRWAYLTLTYVHLLLTPSVFCFLWIDNIFLHSEASRRGAPPRRSPLLRRSHHQKVYLRVYVRVI